MFQEAKKERISMCGKKKSTVWEKTQSETCGRVAHLNQAGDGRSGKAKANTRNTAKSGGLYGGGKKAITKKNGGRWG